MTKTWYEINTGEPLIVPDGTDISTHPYFQEMPRTDTEARLARNALLAQTDWWAVSDRTMTAAQTSYRQALRDISDHADWPALSDSDWPVAPSV